MRTFLLTMALMAMTTSALAGGSTTWRVGNAGDAACDFHDLQDAIDEAASQCSFASPCVIELSGSANQHRGNTYTIDGADLAGNASQLFITGGFDSCSASEPSGQTILDADGNGRVFTILYAADFADPPAFTTHLSNVFITGGVPADGEIGGGVLIEGRSGRQFVTMNNVNIEGNTATHGGGLSIRASSHQDGVSGSWVVLNDSVVANNGATLFGGGIDCTHAPGTDANNPIEFNDVRVSTNIATTGGGVYVSNCVEVEFSSTAGLPDSGRIRDNIATAAGGGLFITGGEATIRTGGGQASALVDGNFAENGGAAFLTGGALLDLIDVRADTNQATQDGGAFYVTNGSLLNMRQSVGQLPTGQCLESGNPRCSGITDNTATSGDGGALYVNNNATALVSQSVIRGNQVGGRGSAGFVGTGAVALKSVGVSGNSGSQSLFHVEGGDLTVAWSTIAGNEPNKGGELRVFRIVESGSEPDLQVLGSIVWEPGAFLISGAGDISTSASCVIGHTDSNFIDTAFYSVIDPGLVDVEGGDLRLALDSPAIDYCGADDVPFPIGQDDLFGNPRGVPFNLATDPAPNPGNGDFDLGVHEQQPFFDEILHDRFEEQVHPKVMR
jgi:hypothetical protein